MTGDHFLIVQNLSTNPHSIQSHSSLKGHAHGTKCRAPALEGERCQWIWTENKKKQGIPMEIHVISGITNFQNAIASRNR